MSRAAISQTRYAAQTFADSMAKSRAKLPPITGPVSRTKQRSTKWDHLREKCVDALRRNWSPYAVSRAYQVPEFTVRRWRKEEAIPPIPTSEPRRPTPEIGEEL